MTRDMPPLPELTDEKLHELAAKRQSAEIETAKDRVFNLEAQLVSARARPVPNAATVPAQKQNLQAIDRLTDELRWARRRLAMIEDGMGSIELRQAKDAAPGASFLFEVTARLMDGG